MEFFKYIIFVNFIVFTKALAEHEIKPLGIIDIQSGQLPKGKCMDQFKDLEQDLMKGEKWALMMLDAGSKSLPNGIMYGNVYNVGNFDECLSIEEVKSSDNVINGKFCFTTIPLNKSLMTGLDSALVSKDKTSSDFTVRMLGADATTFGVHLTFCIPSACTADDMNTVVPIFKDEYCRTAKQNDTYSTGAVISIVVFSIVIGIAILSTCYDLYLYYNNLNSSSEVYVAFSLFTNGKKLLKSSHNPDQLLCLHGLRAISMMWVILGHIYSMQGFIINYSYVDKWMHNSSNMFVLGATVSVDTFFAVGGIVTVYSFLNAADRGVKFNLPLFYIHRYLRLTPALAAVMLFYTYLLTYTGNGPLWEAEVDINLIQGCKDLWWGALLYVQNYVLGQSMCIGQTWYLSVDMHLFILSPIILIPLKKWPKYALGMLGILIVAGIVSPLCISWFKNIPSSVQLMDPHSFKDYYMATHARFGPYVIGMLFGYYIYQIKKNKLQPRVNLAIVYISWLVLLTGLTACVYGAFVLDENSTRLQNALHIGFNRSAWALGICLLVVLCVSGYGGPINYFLGASVFQIIAKLSYSMYLVHYALVQVKIASFRTQVYFSNYEMFFDYWGYFVETIVISAILCLLFESPVIILEKKLFGGCSKSAKSHMKKIQQTP